MKWFITSFTLFIYFVNSINSDKPCAARYIDGRSVICVCNATYCDEFTREAPEHGFYVTYTSSKAGSRFQKNTGTFQYLNQSSEILDKIKTSFVINPKIKYQAAEGFGGAVTDAAAINWKSLPENLQQYLIDSYFSSKGLEYNMLRVPIGGCDFSTHPYAYNELPENDSQLSNYTLGYEDYYYKIPMMKAISNVATSSILIVATTWSPPKWMKTNHNLSGVGQLKREYFITYALYHYKFLEKYAQEGVNIWAITTTNEPIDGFFGLAKFNSLGWSIENMAEWIVNDLGPMIRSSKFKDVKIITCDDQRFTVPFFFNVDLNYNVVGWIDWNLCLNMQGGPNWAENYADSAVIVNAAMKEFYKQPMFYAMGHFSKFIKRGSRRIEIKEKKSFFAWPVKNVAFLTPDGSVVVVLLNEGDTKTVSVQCGRSQAILQLEADSVTTMEFYCEIKFV